MENTPTPPPSVAPIEAVATNDPVAVVEQSTPVESEFKDGGEIDGKGSFKLVYYITFGLLISASLYSIYYHRQAMNKLFSGEEDALKRELSEVKSNLKRLMGSKYEVITK